MEPGALRSISGCDTSVTVQVKKRPHRLPPLQGLGKGLLVLSFVYRNLLQFRPLGNEVHGAVEDLGETAAVVAQALQPDGGALAAATRPALEQIEEAVEQLAVRVAEQLVTHVAELGGVAPQRLRRIGQRVRFLQLAGGVAA